jgi:ABC-2 type transport system permease protein
MIEVVDLVKRFGDYTAVDPLSYEVDALRDLMLVNGISAFGLGTDFLILFVATIVLVIVGARLYPRVAY